MIKVPVKILESYLTATRAAKPLEVAQVTDAQLAQIKQAVADKKPLKDKNGKIAQAMMSDLLALDVTPPSHSQ